VQDPLSVFGALLHGCIREDNQADDRKLLKEGVAFLLLGVVSSVVTTYVVASLGLLV
jgi:hypothetical protein